MLKSFGVDNFKSLIDVTLEPVGLNLFVGSNNAGKTNLCQALRFLSLTARLSLDDAAAACTPEPWNLLNVYSSKESLSLSAECKLTLGEDPLVFSYNLTLRSKKGLKERARGRPF